MKIRITREDDRYYNGKTCGGWKKLQKLENIEDDIGVSLVIKDKVERSGFCYWKDKNKELYKLYIKETSREGVWIDDYDEYKLFLPYYNYGKTWALTKEELKNE